MFGFTNLPCSLYDLPAVETWLADQEKKGKRFIGFSGEQDAKFEEGEPRNEVYRLEPSDGNRRPDPEQEELFRAAGWEYHAASFHDDLWVFRACRPDPVPIHTDPETQAIACQRLQKRLVRRTVPYVLLLAVLGALNIWLWGRQTASLADLVERPYPLLNTAYWVFYCLFFGGLAVADLLPLGRLVRSLKAGIPMEHTVRRRNDRRYWRWAFLAVVVLYLGACFYTANRYEYAALYAEDCAGKYVTMETLGMDDGGYGPEGQYQRSVLGEIWSVDEGEPVREDTEYGYTTHWPVFTRLYRLRFTAMAAPLAKELRQDIGVMADAEPLTDTGLDEAWYARTGEGQSILLRNGGAVLYMRADGAAEDLRDHLSDFAAVLKG